MVEKFEDNNDFASKSKFIRRKSLGKYERKQNDL